MGAPIARLDCCARANRFTGEIRAVGEVLVDMLPLLARTGFDSVVLRHDQDLAAAKRALGFFPAFYQGDVLHHQPHFADAAAKSEGKVGAA